MFSFRSFNSADHKKKPDPISLRAICVIVFVVFSDFCVFPFFSRINVELEIPRLESLAAVSGGDEEISAGSFLSMPRWIRPSMFTSVAKGCRVET